MLFGPLLLKTNFVAVVADIVIRTGLCVVVSVGLKDSALRLRLTVEVSDSGFGNGFCSVGDVMVLVVFVRLGPSAFPSLLAVVTSSSSFSFAFYFVTAVYVP